VSDHLSVHKFPDQHENGRSIDESEEDHSKVDAYSHEGLRQV
jgi:hypothetical protein